MGFWNRIRELFTEAEESSPTHPVEHEVLLRHKQMAPALAQWRGGVVAGKLLTEIERGYAAFLQGERAGTASVEFLDTPSTKGFVLFFDSLNYTFNEAQLLQLLLRERVLAAGYRTQVADLRRYALGKGVEQTDRYYLKPRMSFDLVGDTPLDMHTAGQLSQGFGNVLVELVTRDERPHLLKLSATVYQDRVYRPADQFAQLIELLVAAPTSS